MNNRSTWVTIYLAMIFVVVLYPTKLLAQSITQLIEENQLTITSKVKLDEAHIIGQPVIFSVEVATNRWFANGTRINNFALNDAIVLANSEITINGSKRIQGQTWSSQIREITFYPSRAGVYKIPPVEVFISVNTENHGVVEGTTSTQAKQFSITLPKELEGIEDFVVSPKVTLSISGEIDSENAYMVGEAIEQTITISAENTPAMMLPPIQLAKLDGISIYKKPSKVIDQSNRGTLIGTRTDSFTYIFEQPGEYHIPAQHIHWWNTQTNTLEIMVIPQQSWQVAGKQTSPLTSKKVWLTSIDAKAITLTLVAFILIYSLFYLTKRYGARIISLYKRLSKQEQRKLANAFIQALTQKQYSNACQLLYQYNNLVNLSDILPEHKLISQLKAHVFAPTSSDLKVINKQQGKEILHLINYHKSGSLPKQTSRTIKLNS